MRFDGLVLKNIERRISNNEGEELLRWWKFLV
jgi:hypothetical protein